MQITGVILAGGKSSRMGGEPKGLLSYKGKTFVELIFTTLTEICAEVIISANSERYNSFSYPVIADKHLDIGPLGGIHSALQFSGSELNIFVPCDMSFVDLGLLKSMVGSASGFEAVVPELHGKITTMPLLLRKGTLSSVEAMIRENQKKVFTLIQNISYARVKWCSAGTESLATKNINSQTDFRELLR